MIPCGARENSVPLAELGTRLCPRCGDWHEFRAHVRYTYIHIYWVFGAVVKRRYLIACDHCDVGTFVPRDEIHAPLGNDPIPIRHRWGFAVALLATLGAIGYIIVSGRDL